MTTKMCDVVQIQGGFKPSVQLPRDFFDKELNRHFVENYIPTQETLDIFMNVRNSLQPHSEHRAKLFTGTYGTGKSDLMLMIANYVTRSSDDPLLKPFFERLTMLDNTNAQMIYDARLNKLPFLLVLLQADTPKTFSSFILDGLEKALIEVGQQDALGTTYYRAAQYLIDSWEREHPDNISRFQTELQETHKMTLAQLRRNLASPEADSALNIFREVTAKSIGMPFHPTAVIERPHEAFEKVVKRLVDEGAYAGIFVIADEFTHLLQILAESTTASPDIKGIDNLAEEATRSGKYQVHFYVVSLEGFSSALASTRTSQAALERTGGRFLQEELRSQYMEELISASIAKKISPKRLFLDVPTQKDELITLTMQLWGNRSTGRYNREWLQKTVVEGCFPLHPLAAYCLPLLNRQLAQNERTMFSFIWDEKCGLKFFIDRADLMATDEWLNLLPLDSLFPYFEINIKEQRSDLYFLYQQAKSKLRPQQVDTGLEGRLLQALVLLDIMSGDPHLRTDRASLRNALGLAPARTAELDTALNQLEQAGIAYPSQAGYYQLVKQGQANPRELRSIIERGAQGVITSPFTLLNEYYRPHDVVAVNYNKARGTDRKLAASFVGSGDLINIVSLQQKLQNVDGLLWYVVARTEEERSRARLSATELTKTFDQLVIAVPLTPNHLIERLKYKISLEQLRNNPDYQRPDYQELLTDRGLVGQDYLSAFNQERQKFDNSSNFEWYFNGKATTVQSPLQLEELASEVMKQAFSATPPHKNAQHLAKNAKRVTTLREALDLISSAPFRRVIKKSPTDAILFSGAEELGLIYFKEKEGGYSIYDVCAPDSTQLSLSRDVWDILDKRLRDGSISWSDIIGELENRPYGLSPQIIALFLAAFLRLNKDYVEVCPTKNPFAPSIDITGDLLWKIVESPKEYVIRYKPLTDSQSEFLREVKTVLAPRVELRISREEAASLRNQVAKLLRLRIKEIPPVTQMPSKEDLAEVLQGSPEETIATCIQLIEIGQLPDESSTAVALLDTLPQHLGLVADSTVWTPTEFKQALILLENAYSTLQQLPKRFRQLVAFQIGQQFGVSEPPKNENDILKAAKQWRKEQVRPIRIGDISENQDARELLRILDDDPYSFEQVFLNALSSRWKLPVFKEWQAISTKKVYLDRLEQAKYAIEELAQKFVPSTDEEIGAIPRMVISSTEISSAVENRQTITPNPQAPLPLHSQVSAVNSSASGLNTPSRPIDATEANISTSSGHQVENIPATRFNHGLQSHSSTPYIAGKVREDSGKATIEQIFKTVKSIIDNLEPKDQRKLWNLLVEEYDPR